MRDASTAARSGRIRNNPKLSFFGSRLGGRLGSWRGRTSRNAARATAPKMRKAPLRPNGSISNAPINGPPVNPASSMPRSRPSRSAERFLSMLPAMARIVGPLVPNDAPVMARAITNVHNVVPKANRTDPSAARINAARTNRFGLPRSA
ncbi:unannotated protein [freshwater metagenome]|uniref:Unannotated protein n=1 Tax=freshwater metagenome TaxID=449393 RepID=A0A6J6DC85_9ZZZZ